MPFWTPEKITYRVLGVGGQRVHGGAWVGGGQRGCMGGAWGVHALRGGRVRSREERAKRAEKL